MALTLKELISETTLIINGLKLRTVLTLKDGQSGTTLTLKG